MGNKKEIRQKFRDVCLKRDKMTCIKCGVKAKDMKDALQIFDVHHINDRSIMPNGGYVLENGITLCKDACHLKAEQFHSTGQAAEGFSVEDLYNAIGSNYELAVKASEKLK